MQVTDALGEMLGEPREALPPLGPTDDIELLLMLTVDTECSVARQRDPNPDRVVDELIFGDFGDGTAGGIGLHMDLLEHFGFRGCFFLDVLMEYQYGRRALERTIEAIAERGHEIQLHVHAHHLLWSGERGHAELAGALARADPDAFRRVMELSVDLFERRVGERPIAYRAGGYRIADEHFPVLLEHGIRIDSSIRFYDKSRVSDWMRTRTRPFWVEGVLEIPPTSVLLRDDAHTWGVRSFVSQAQLSVDPLPALAAEAGTAPQVATYVSHSFQLLRRHRETDPTVLAAWKERLRPTMPARLADVTLRRWDNENLTYGDEVDDQLVAQLAEMLRGVASRPGARCATFTDLDRVVDRCWPATSERPADPIVVLDRRRGIATATGMRVLGEDLLAHLASRTAAGRVDTRQPDSEAPPGAWLDTSSESSLRDALEAVSAPAEPGAQCRVRVPTLGVGPATRRGTLPPLAEILFPLDAVRRVAAASAGGEVSEIAWDVPTWLAWFESQGFAVSRPRRIARQATELDAIDRFIHKLRWLDPYELRTGAIEVDLRRRQQSREQAPASTPIVELAHDEITATGALPSDIAPALLPTTASHLYEALHPGHELRLRVNTDPSPASRTTIVLALLRAGFETLEATPTDNLTAIDYRLLRPVELSDIRRFGGLA